MKRISFFAVIADSALSALCAFALIFTAVRFYTKNPALGLGLGIAAFLLFGALAFLRLNAKRGKAAAYGAGVSRRRNFATYLCTLSPDAAAGIIAKALGGTAEGARVLRGESIYISKFTPQPLSPNDICGAIAFESDKKKIVACNGATDDAKKFASIAGAQVVTSDEIFDKLEDMGALPEKYPFAEAAKPKLREALKGAIKRANAGRLFWCGLWLTAFSYFTFFPVYYIIAGGLMLIFAAVCLIFGKRD